MSSLINPRLDALSGFRASLSVTSVLAAAAGVRQLFHDFVEIEAAGLLPRRERSVGLQVLAHDVLRRDDQEGVLDAPPVVVSGVALGALEGIRAQVHELGEAQRHQRVLPHIETYGTLLQEQELPLLIAQGGELAVIGPVEKLLALARTGAGQQIALVVAVEVNREGFARSLVAGQ